MTTPAAMRRRAAPRLSAALTAAVLSATVLGSALALYGCGQKGPLVLPTPPARESGEPSEPGQEPREREETDDRG